MIDYESRPYRPCVGLVVKNADGLVLMGERLDNLGAWQFPQGGIEAGEEPHIAALRELYEETNIRSITIIAQTNEWLYYDIPLHLANKLWDGTYRGQKQLWFLCQFHGEQHEIQLDSHTPEFNQYRFVPFDQAINLTVPFKQEIYHKIYQEFKQWF